MIRIPLSQSGPADQFAAQVQGHIEACNESFAKGRVAPKASPLVEMLVGKASDGSFYVLPYEIYDDAVSPDQGGAALLPSKAKRKSKRKSPAASAAQTSAPLDIRFSKPRIKIGHRPMDVQK